MDLIKQAALNAGIDIVDYDLVFSPPLEKTYADIQYIVCHHDVWPGGTMASIHNDHKNNQGYRGTGYHVRFPASGGIEIGRPHGMIGGHCKQNKMNYQSIGLVWEGNLDHTQMTDAQFKDSSDFIASYIKLTNMPIDHIVGHGDYAVKSCPGKNFPMTALKKKVRALLDEESNTCAPWAEGAQNFVMTTLADGLPLSDGTRPFEPVTRQEQWVMMERLYKVMMNEIKKINKEV